MKQLAPIFAIIALSACATTSGPKNITSLDATQKAVPPPSSQSPNAKVASADCDALYNSYKTTMAAFQPPKKSFLEKGLSLGGAATSMFAGKLIGSGVHPKTLLNVQRGISAAETLNGNNNFQNMINATSALGATQAAFAQADELGCDKTKLAQMAQANH